MKTSNPNLFFFVNEKDARKKFKDTSSPCDLIENSTINHKGERVLNGFYVEIRTGEKTLAEIGHRNDKLIAQK